VMKAAARILSAVFVGLFGTLELSLTVCRISAVAVWTRQLCTAHPIVSPLLSFALLFFLTLMLLSRRCMVWRVPIAVLLLVSYGLYGIADAIGYGVWWIALVPAVALLAAIGLGLRQRWGTLLTYAISVLFGVYWVWGILAAIRAGTFASRPPLEVALSFVPGMAFALLAGFCCYVVATPRRGATHT
jgi:hypothetical protein